MRVLILSILTIPCFGAASNVSSQPPVLPFEARGGAYVSRGANYTVTVTPARETLNASGRAVSMWAVNASPAASLEALGHMPGKANYFLGRDVRASYDLYERIRWRNVYAGIDAIFHANREHFEYDFEIAPRREPSRIRLAFEGIDSISIDRNGDLVLTSGALRIDQPRPIAYQVVSGKRRLVDVAYTIDASNHVRFRTGAYDRHLPLVIDPQIVFDKTFGGSGQTTTQGFARDAQGNLYVAGSTNSTDFGTVNAVQKQLGTAPLAVTGNAGGSWSFPSLPAATSVQSIAAAPSAPSTFYAATPVGVFRSTTAGITWTTAVNTGLNGPATTLAVDSGSATTVYAGTAQSLYVSTNGGATWQVATNGIAGQGIATVAASPTQAGTVFASVQNPPALFRSADSGQTWTMLTFPVPLQGPVNALVFTSNGGIVAATSQGVLISSDGGNTWTPGANQAVENNQGLAISLSTNTLYLFNAASPQLERSTDGGQTFSPVLPAAKLSYLTRIAVDPNNPSTVYVADYNLLYRSTDSGQTWNQLSLPYPITPQTVFVSPADSRFFLGAYTQNNAFVTKWSPDGSQVLYSTYLGGNGADQAVGIAVDPLGNAYITGTTTSPNFPTTNGAILNKLTSTQDIFVAKLSADGSQLLYSTLLGSQSANPTAIAVDLNGSAVITGQAGASFPVTSGAFQQTPLTGCTVAFPSAGFLNSGSAFLSKLMSNGDAFVFSTLFGGSCGTYATNVAIDGGGNAWVVGSTTSPDFPVTTDALQPKLAAGYGFYDGFLTRFGPGGHLDYSTFIGGPGYDSLNGIAFDVPGNIYLTGESGGLNVPPRSGFQPQPTFICPTFGFGPSVFQPQGNGIILKLDPTAQMIEELTYLGAPGCLNPSSIAVDSGLNVWISGNLNTPNPTPPTVGPVQIGGSGFVSQFSPDLTQLLFSTYFDSVAGLALDTSGFAYVAGSRSSATQTSYVAKLDPTPPSISIDSISSVDARVAPSNFFGIAPGELILINGRNIGPASTVPGAIQQGFLTNNVAGVQVMFDGVAVPLLSVGAQQIELVTPFELAGKSKTTIQVQYGGSPSNAVQVPVNAVDVQILGVFNADFTPNSQSNPAQPNSSMVMYIAGLGNTNPPSQDGQINGLPLASTPAPIQIEWFTNQPLTFLPVNFAGAAYGLAAGIYQINFVAPPQTVEGLELLMGNSVVASFNVFVSQ